MVGEHFNPLSWWDSLRGTFAANGAAVGELYGMLTTTDREIEGKLANLQQDQVYADLTNPNFSTTVAEAQDRLKAIRRQAMDEMAQDAEIAENGIKGGVSLVVDTAMVIEGGRAVLGAVGAGVSLTGRSLNTGSKALKLKRPKPLGPADFRADETQGCSLV